MDTIVTGLEHPLQLAQPPGDDRVFIAEQRGRIRILRDGNLVNSSFLDITADAGLAPERGLIGMVFDPDFSTNGHLYVNFTDHAGDIRIQRFTATPGSDRVDTGTRVEILTIEREPGPHNAGLLRFGPDGYLWIAVGDGGHSHSAQNTASMGGSLLRIDVHGGEPYAIPPDNPFVGDPQARPEIWATGLRNPWRFSLDEDHLFIADVGQTSWEELNVVDRTAGGLNFGWPVMEGPECYDGGTCDQSGYTLPAFSYEHPSGCSIIGGEIYRGSELPQLAGRYVFADLCGWIGSVAVDGTTVSDLQVLEFGEIGYIHSLGTDAAGEVYVLFGTGEVIRLRADPGA